MDKYLDKLLEKSIENGWYDGYTIDTAASEIQKVLLEFGRQCFEAGRDKEYDKVDGDYYDEFRDFDEYLKVYSMLLPIILPTYVPHTPERVVEVDKHVDTVTVRKDLFDKYEKFYKELSKFPNRHKYEFDFEAVDPSTMKYGGKLIFSFTGDNNEELLKRLENICQKIVNHNIDSYKYVEEFRSPLGIKNKKLQFKLDYISLS